MTTRHLAWGIVVWPFLLVLELIGHSSVIGYDWDMSSSSVIGLICGWAAAALVIASLLWLPAGTRLLRVLRGRSRAAVSVGFGVLGLALGIVASVILGSIATVSAFFNGSPPSGDAIASALSYLTLAPLFVLPSVLGGLFASVNAQRSLAGRPKAHRSRS